MRAADAKYAFAALFMSRVLANSTRVSKMKTDTCVEKGEWLYDAGIINICYNLSNLSLPLEGNKLDNIFKIYMQDTGLFVAMLEEEVQAGFLAEILGCIKALYTKILLRMPKSANTVFKNKDQHGVNQCIKLSANNVGQEGEKLTLPYYMVFLLG